MNEVVYECTECGKKHTAGQMEVRHILEPWGETDVWACPSCHSVDFEGRELFVEVKNSLQIRPEGVPMLGVIITLFVALVALACATAGFVSSDDASGVIR